VVEAIGRNRIPAGRVPVEAGPPHWCLCRSRLAGLMYDEQVVGEKRISYIIERACFLE